ncbi:ketopantoate reductase family protein [Sporosarcina sp. HYO08]|uniref:ketopantoate reductase family protein n=1 Tax=Sporosarcina sp. HYO08 TaxID=1759557 RepID=UPI00079C1D2C|nr:2-dehydropantoate 2-reductase [Sporosarcina sp. HYO08]KXH79889.1 hypothetical protein AU377_10450 [Sporosarcina sp. HYO08]
MDIVIAGAGSIGLLVGSYLSEAGFHVTFYVRREEQARLIRENGVCRVNQDHSETIVPADASTELSKLPASALWIVAVKYAHLQSLLKSMGKVNNKNPILFLQNGIGHVPLIRETGLCHVAFATVEHGAKRMNDWTVSHNGVGMIAIAAEKGNDQLFTLIGQAASAQFPILFKENAERILMRKVLINCMINPLTAILGVENGDLIENPYCLTLFQNLYEELIGAFPKMASDLSYEDVVAVCRNTARNQSSMLVDRLAGRQMEIDTIVSAVIERANDQGKQLPILQTFEQMLYAINQKGESL